jgi:DNA modification methylase
MDTRGNAKYYRTLWDDSTDQKPTGAARRTSREYEVSAEARPLPPFTLERMPKALQERLRPLVQLPDASHQRLTVDAVHKGDARELIPNIKPNSIALSVWSPPYFVGKSYESKMTFADWQELLRDVIGLHFSVIKPGGFLVINIADILCFKDASMPRIQAEALKQRRSPVTRDDVLKAMQEHPEMNRYQLAELLRCSEQTIDRRLNGNNIRGGKYETQTRVKIVGGLIEQWALEAGFYTHDRRIWVKDAAWENSRWASLSYRSVDEFEYLYFFWKPGVTTVDRTRLTKAEWKDWGSRGVWMIQSVRANDDHEAKFPIELPRRVIRLLTSPGETVLDCFLGSGTTAIAALQEDRHFIGIEKDSKYVALSLRRIGMNRRG